LTVAVFFNLAPIHDMYKISYVRDKQYVEIT